MIWCQWCCSDVYGNYKPVLWKSDPLRFSGLPPHVEKNGWRRSCQCAYCFSCLFTNKVWWSVWPLFSSPVCSCSHDLANAVRSTKTGMCLESCQVSVGNIKQLLLSLPENENILFQNYAHLVDKWIKFCKKYNFCITSWNMTGAEHFWLFSIENLKFPWQWWLHQHWAALAVKRLKQLTHYLLTYFGRYRWFAAASRWRPTNDLTEWDSWWTRMEKLCRCPLSDDNAGKHAESDPVRLFLLTLPSRKETPVPVMNTAGMNLMWGTNFVHIWPGFFPWTLMEK